jgi:adenylosuccinate lyase
MRVWSGEGTLEHNLASDPDVARWLDAEALAACFDPRRYLRNVDAIYERLF